MLNISTHGNDIYVSGNTNTPGLGTPGTYQSQLMGNSDGFVLKLNASSNRIWHTYLGGASLDAISGNGLSVDKRSNLYIGGVSLSRTNFADSPAYNTLTVSGNPFLAYFDSSGNKKWIRYTQTDSAYTGIPNFAISVPYATASGNMYYLRTQKSNMSRPLLGYNTYQNSVNNIQLYTQLFTKFTDTVGMAVPPPPVVLIPPINDSCAKATGIMVNPGPACNYTYRGITLNATTGTVPACTSGTDDDVWYRFQAIDSVHIVSLTRSSLPLAYAIYGGTCSNPGQAVFCSTNSYDTIHNLVAGQQYFLRIWTIGNNVADSFTVCISTPVHAVQVLGWNIFPVPAKSYITLLSPFTENLPFVFYQSDGKRALAGHTNGIRTRLDLRAFSGGVYHLVVWLPDGTKKTFKILR